MAPNPLFAVAAPPVGLSMDSRVSEQRKARETTRKVQGLIDLLHWPMRAPSVSHGKNPGSNPPQVIMLASTPETKDPGQRAQTTTRTHNCKNVRCPPAPHDEDTGSIFPVQASGYLQEGDKQVRCGHGAQPSAQQAPRHKHMLRHAGDTELHNWST